MIHTLWNCATTRTHMSPKPQQRRERDSQIIFWVKQRIDFFRGGEEDTANPDSAKASHRSSDRNRLFCALQSGHPAPVLYSTVGKTKSRQETLWGLRFVVQWCLLNMTTIELTHLEILLRRLIIFSWNLPNNRCKFKRNCNLELF